MLFVKLPFLKTKVRFHFISFITTQHQDTKYNYPFSSFCSIQNMGNKKFRDHRPIHFDDHEPQFVCTLNNSKIFIPLRLINWYPRDFDLLTWARNVDFGLKLIFSNDPPTLKNVALFWKWFKLIVRKIRSEDSQSCHT